MLSPTSIIPSGENLLMDCRILLARYIAMKMSQRIRFALTSALMQLLLGLRSERFISTSNDPIKSRLVG